MPHTISEQDRDLQNRINRAHDRSHNLLDSLVTFAPPIDERPRAMAPAGATYPRAAVVHELDGKWTISIKHTAEHLYGDYILDLDGKPLAFDLHRGALTHAAHSIHALRARRHPAGQSWLKGGGGSR